ncbi:enoyl-CoA hydratase/isomerase family protein [Mycobacterium barrassiae]|uniref:enoyl-CoA hydratase/isomerase family protein n=1 Tax=Mycobacterium barrassiae TaxID=319709 RepID=UPI00226597FA|nr:enoyl-CoA hydratase/isomerase family protein [Mycobacterium barrassiae]MCV7301313.1 enoyl-CoA hydratase/isomerase family protein [Mycobacterium barrassiae]
MTRSADEVVTFVDGATGELVLNRPSAINSLNQSMIDALKAAMSTWENDDKVQQLVLSGAGGRGLCAGGDVIALYHSARGDGAEARRFWFDEYCLIAEIASYPKPFVTIMDGMVMGGGVGVGAHASVRVVSETSQIAMPEVGIGFVPDVGGTYLLSRAPGLIGLHAALTGTAFSGSDAIAIGFADHYVPSAMLGAFERAIPTEGIEAALSAYTVRPPTSHLLEQRSWIDECYAGDTVGEIVDNLCAHRSAEASDAASIIATRSPTALTVTLQAVRRAGNLRSLEEVLRQEYRVSCAALRSQDFVEGIRAQLIDKDRNPRWSPASLEAVSDDNVEQFFATTENIAFG